MLRFLFVSLPLLLLFVIALGFGALNKSVLTVDFIFFKAELSVAVVTACFLVLGFVLGMLSMLARQLLLRRENRRLRRQTVQQNTDI